MSFLRHAGLPGLIYMPRPSCRRKHYCRDCHMCQFCSDERCDACLRAKRKKKGKSS